MGYYVIGKTTTLQHFKAVEERFETKLKTDFRKKGEDAKTIENFLKDLKDLNLNHPVQRAIIDRVNNITGKKLSALFQNQGGDTFEEEMAVLLQALFEDSGFADKVVNSLFDSKNFNLNSNIVLSQNIGIGTITGNLKGKVINSEGKTLSSKKHSQLHSLLKTGSEINKFLSQEDKVSYKQLTSAGLKQTKSDIMLEEYDLSYLETGKLKEILKALNGARFSLKNYDTLSGIHLGDTSPYKAYSSILSSLGYSEEEINESYYRALNCIDSIHLNTGNHEDHEGLIHLGHIQSVYELTGLGLTILKNGQVFGSERVDYIVINNYNGNDIKVISSYELIKEIFDKNNQSKKRISLNQNILGGGSSTISVK